jgi:polymorphic membrane protein
MQRLRRLGTLLLALLGAATPSAAAAADFGNPGGHFPVPAAGRAVSAAHPDHVIGNGTPSSCTSAAVVRDVAAGGVITFDCGPGPHTIVMTNTARVPNTRRRVVLDGGGLITLSGGGKRRILFSDTCAGIWSTSDCVNQPDPQIVVQNITFRDGYDGAHQATCAANAPRCWYGGVDGGGAIYVEGGQFKAVNARFVDNRCYSFGPDLGGGAIRALAQYENRPVHITNDTFVGGRCSNGGALSSISVQWDIRNSRFTDNKAVGWGANPASRGTPGGGSGGAIYLDGKNDNVLIAGTVMSDNTAREGGGAVFDVVDTGWGALTFNQSHLHHNSSGVFQTFPGVYYEIDGHDRRPVMTRSSAN